MILPYLTLVKQREKGMEGWQGRRRKEGNNKGRKKQEEEGGGVKEEASLRISLMKQ